MRDAHIVNAWLLIGLNAIAGIWCLAAHRWKRLEGRAMWIAVIVAELTVFVQAVLGAVYSKRSGVPIHDMHMLYGVSAIVAVAILYSYRGSAFIKSNLLLMYGFGSLFIMGLGLRNLVL